MKGEHPITRRRFEARLASRAALARKAGVSRTTVVRAEQGDPLGFTAGYRIARALGITYDELRAEIPGQLPADIDGEEQAA